MLYYLKLPVDLRLILILRAIILRLLLILILLVGIGLSGCELFGYEFLADLVHEVEGRKLISTTAVMMILLLLDLIIVAICCPLDVHYHVVVSVVWKIASYEGQRDWLTG